MTNEQAALLLQTALDKDEVVTREGTVAFEMAIEALQERTTAQDVAETPEFHEGELIVYQNGDTFEIGEIKRICDDGAFVYYHEGDTASKTPFENMHKLRNAYCIKQTSFALDRPRCGSCRHFSECSAMTDIETTTDASNCSEYEMIIRRTEQ